MPCRAARAVAVLLAIAGAARADRVRVPPGGVPPIAVAIVVEGHVMFARGTVADPAPLAAVAHALDEVVASAPPGAMAALVTYGNAARVRRAMAAMATLSGSALEPVVDYDDQIQRDLPGGVAAGIAELDTAGAAARALLVIGDGGTTDPARDEPALARLRERCAASGIEVYAVVHPVEAGEAGRSITAIASRIRLADRASDLPAAVRETFRELGSDAIRAAAARRAAGARRPASDDELPLAWVLLAAGVALAAIGGGVLVWRRFAR